MSYYSGGESALGSASTVDPDRPPSRNRTQIRGHTPEPPIGLGVGLVNGLGNLSTSRADKRGSINPEMVMSFQQQQNHEEPLSGPSSALNSNKDFYSGRSSPSPVMDSFSTGRHSPLPNSPLRASFTDAEARENEKAAARGASHLPSPTSKNWPSANSRLAPGGQSQSQTTSKGRTPISRTHSESNSTADTPPRSSSLTDSMDVMVNKDSSGPVNDRDDETIKEKTLYKRMPSSDATTPQKSLQTQSNVIDAPRIDAPAWSSLGFSLSDPDFAKLLAENKASPEKAKQVLAAREASPARSRLQTTAGERLQPLQQPLRTPSSSSLPASPVLTHSPPLQTIMATYAADTGKGADRPKRSDSLRSLKGREVEPQSQTGERRQRPVLVKTKTSSEDLAAGMSELKIPVHETTLPVLEALLASLTDTSHSNAQVTMKKELLERVINEIQTLSDQVTVLKDKYSGARVRSGLYVGKIIGRTMEADRRYSIIQRTSLHYMEGMSVAGEEYEKAVQARLEAETEVARLKAEMHGQTARLSLIAEDERRQESLKRQSNDLALNLSGLEKDVSKLKVERDITLAEVQELAATKA